jgi:23S rRNA (cytosine1962-C5)-methyltransferase
MKSDYTLLDSGSGRKLERFGPYVIARPCAQAVWQPTLSIEAWNKADAQFTREPDNRWLKKQGLKEFWTVDVASVRFKLSPTDFGHLGIFPEQRPFWEWIAKTATPEMKVLNLFAYSGGSTLAAARGGAQVCHLDASKGMVAWARENAAFSGLAEAPIRWITDDVNKFLAREIKRNSRYEGIILDPPSFGRGSHGEVFKIEEEINSLLKTCRELLSDKPKFLLFSCHTPGFTPIVMEHLLSQAMRGIPGTIDSGEMVLSGDDGVMPVPSGTFARWQS